MMYALIQAAMTRLAERYNDAKSDGSVSWSEAFKIFFLAVMEVIRLLETLPGDGAAKKAAAMEAAGAFFDAVIKPIDLPGIPNLFEGVFDAGLRKVTLALTDGAIEALVLLYNQIGWPQDEVAPKGV